MQGMSTANRGWVYGLQMQSCCSHGPGGGSTYGGQDYQGGTVSHGGSTHQGGLRCNHNLHTQRSWNVSGGMHTVGGCHESSSYGTPESISVWKLSHIAHTCMDGYLQQGETKEVLFSCVFLWMHIDIQIGISGFALVWQIMLPRLPLHTPGNKRKIIKM